MNREATGLAGARYLSFETIGSTNAEALARARAGERGPLWITAKIQETGRGRRGHAWASPAGNLYASLLLTEPSPKMVAAQLSFVAALALHDAVGECASQIGPALHLKWPNDVLLGGAKVAGILIEGEDSPVFAVVIGMGVNCRSHPPATAFPATDLAAVGAHVNPEVLFAAPTGSSARRDLERRSACDYLSVS